MQPTEFEDLIQRHAGVIRKVAHAYCRRDADRDDVVQEILVQLWRSRARFDGRAKVSTWIYRVALNVAISAYRRERRHRDRRAEFDESAVVARELPDSTKDDVRRLMTAIDRLDELNRALVLLDLDGNDHASIADVLGLSTSNVSTRLHRIRKRLEADLHRTEPGASS